MIFVDSSVWIDYFFGRIDLTTTKRPYEDEY